MWMPMMGPVELHKKSSARMFVEVLKPETPGLGRQSRTSRPPLTCGGMRNLMVLVSMHGWARRLSAARQTPTMQTDNRIVPERLRVRAFMICVGCSGRTESPVEDCSVPFESSLSRDIRLRFATRFCAFRDARNDAIDGAVHTTRKRRVVAFIPTQFSYLST